VKLENEFVVPVPREQAWDVLMDVERIAPCMPGATFDGQDGDAFKGRVKVKLGPITVTYAGVATFIERDKEAGHAVIDASGKEARGSGTAKATIDTVLVDQGDSTLVKVVTDLAITGKPAQFGRGVMVEVGTKILGQFADCLAAQLGSGTAVGHDAAGAAGTEDAAAPAAAPAGDNVVDLSDAQRSRASAGAAAARPAPSPAHHSHDAIDLLDAAGVPVLKRVLPLIGGLFGLWILWRVIRRLGRD
jgi:carbon monoxide dehydrogenase subunit G